MSSPTDTGIRYLVLTQEQFEKLHEYAQGDSGPSGHGALCERIWSKTRVRNGLPIAVIRADESALLRELTQCACTCGCQGLLRAILEQQPEQRAAG
jgi:hypothetical protein